MKRKRTKHLAYHAAIWGLVMAALASAPMAQFTNAYAALEPDSKTLLLDDFSTQNSSSALGTMWRCFTDRVMGGVSNASHTVEERDGIGFMRLEGDVSLENNGGFVQVALDLNRRGQSLDASAFTGVRMIVRGEGGPYYVHFKNAQTPEHWNYFEAPFSVSDEWREIEIPFDTFQSDRGTNDMDPSTLRRIAVVAAHEAQRANVSIDRIAFYK
jgi:hypothetical protein